MLLISLTPLSVVRYSFLEHVRVLPPDSSGEVGGALLLFCGFSGGGLFKGLGFFMFEKDSLRTFLFCYSCLWYF